MRALANRPGTPDNDKHSPARIRWSAVRQAATRCLLVVVVLIGVFWSLPDSALKQAVTPSLAPIAWATGLDQNWRMFAPNPPRVFSDVAVVVEMRDGTKRVWRFNADQSNYNLFNWDSSRKRKMKEAVISQKGTRAGFAAWVVRQVTKPNEQPVRVTIVLETQPVAPPGKATAAKVDRKVLYDQKFAGAK